LAAGYINFKVTDLPT